MSGFQGTKRKRPLSAPTAKARTGTVRANLNRKRAQAVRPVASPTQARGADHVANERVTEDFVRAHFKSDPLFSAIKLDEQKTSVVKAKACPICSKSTTD